MAKLSTTPGSIIAGRYRIIQQIGAGGMGMVFRCHDMTLDDVVALKLLLPHLAADESIFKRFRNEVLVARTLTHQNIVRIHDITPAEDGHYCISMEYVDGVSLKDMIYGIPGHESETQISLSFDQRLAIYYQVLTGVAYAHGKGVIHRDLKPANVLISSAGEVKIVDFGTARIVGSDTSLTVTGQMIGTPDYMAPEQIKGEQLTSSCDIYALGIMGYELGCGQKPFRAESSVALAFKHISEPLPDLRKVAVYIPDWYADLVAKSAAKEKSERFASATEVMATIKHNAPELVAELTGDQTETFIASTVPKKMVELKQEKAAAGDAEVLSTFGGFPKGPHNTGTTFFNFQNPSKPGDDGWSLGTPNDISPVQEIDALERQPKSPRFFWLVIVLLVLVGCYVYLKEKKNIPTVVASLSGETQSSSAKAVPTPRVVSSHSSSSAAKVVTAASTPEVGKIIVEKPVETKIAVPPESRPAHTPLSSEPVQAIVPSVMPAEVKSQPTETLEATPAIQPTTVATAIPTEAPISTPTPVPITVEPVKPIPTPIPTVISTPIVTPVATAKPVTPAARATAKPFMPEFEAEGQAEAVASRETEESGGERKVPWKLPVVQEPKQATFDARPSLDIFRDQGTSTGAISEPTPEATAATETYRGQASLSSDANGHGVKRTMTLNIAFGETEISGSAQVSGIGEMKAKGKVYPRGFELDLFTGETAVRLTGARRDGVLRGRYYCSNPKESGTWDASR